MKLKATLQGVSYEHEYDSSLLLDVPFANLYPIQKADAEIIAYGFTGQETPVELKRADYNTSYWLARNDDLNTEVIIVREAKAIRKPTVRKLCGEGIPSFTAMIVVPEYTSTANKVLDEYNAKGDNNFLFRISDIMTAESRKTLPIFLGKNATKGFGKAGDPKQKITIIIPAKGFPELGFGGTLFARDIYNILQMKIDATGGQMKPLTIALLDSFKELLGLLNSNRTITVKRWNDTMEKNKIFDLIKEAGL